MYLSPNGKLHCKDRKFKRGSAEQTELSGRKQRPLTNDCRWGLDPVQTRLSGEGRGQRVQPLSSNTILSLSTQLQPKQRTSKTSNGLIYKLQSML